MSKQPHHPRLAALLNYFDRNTSSMSSSHSQPQSRNSQREVYDTGLHSHHSHRSQSSTHTELFQKESYHRQRRQSQTTSEDLYQQDDIRDGVENDSIREVHSEEIFDFLQGLKDDVGKHGSQYWNTNKCLNNLGSDSNETEESDKQSPAHRVLAAVENVNRGKTNLHTGVHFEKEYHSIGNDDCLSLTLASSSQDSEIETILGPHVIGNNRTVRPTRRQSMPWSRSERLMEAKRFDKPKANLTSFNRKDSQLTTLKKTVRFSNELVENSKMSRVNERVPEEKEYIYFSSQSEDSNVETETEADYSDENNYVGTIKNESLRSKCEMDNSPSAPRRRGDHSVWQNKQLHSFNAFGESSPGQQILLGNQAIPIPDNDFLESSTLTRSINEGKDSNEIDGANEIIDKIIEEVQIASVDAFDNKFDTSLLLPISRLIAVDLWSDRKDIVKQALRTLLENATVIEGKQEILDCGGHLALVVALKRWSASADVIVEACNTLEKAARFASFFADAVVRVGGLEVILHCMKEYSHDERVQGSGCSALCAIAWSRKNAEIFVFKLDGIITFYDAMIAFPYSTLVMQNACWYFHHISSWTEFRRPSVTAGVLGALSNAIETYTTDTNDDKIIQLNAREALKNLVVS